MADIGQVYETLFKTFREGTCRPLSYRRSQLYALARLCQENQDALFEALFTDLGKPKLEFLAYEVGAVVERALTSAEKLEEWSAPEPRTNVPDWQKGWNPTVYRAPKGPILVISPWNYPLILTLQSIIAAIAAGCPAVAKPSELVPTFSSLLATLFPKYLDPKAYVVINGAVSETTTLLSLKWAHIFYTGNGRVGRIVATAAAKHLTPVSLELGGKSPVYVDAESLSPAELRVVASRILYGKCANSGQTCVAPDYVLIPRTAQLALVDAFASIIEERYPDSEGGPLQSTSYGRIINPSHFSRLKSLLTNTKGNIVIGGQNEESRLKIAPTIVTDVSLSDPLMADEIFGPILPIVPVSDLSDAIIHINSGDNPLSMYVFTLDPEVKKRLLEETLSGSIIFNDTFDQLAVSDLPFSGVGESGYGTQILRYGYEGFTHLRSSEDVPLTLEPVFSARYPPHTPDKLEFMSAATRIPIPTE